MAQPPSNPYGMYGAYGAPGAYGAYGSYNAAPSTTHQDPTAGYYAPPPSAQAPAPAPQPAAAPAASAGYGAYGYGGYGAASSAPVPSAPPAASPYGQPSAPTPAARQPPPPPSSSSSPPASAYGSAYNAPPPAAAPPNNFAPAPQQQSQHQQPPAPAAAASVYPPPNAAPKAVDPYAASQQQQQPPSTSSRHHTSSEQKDRGVRQLARAPPRRTVQPSSAPNPQRDIHYTDIPQEYETTKNRPPMATVDFIGMDNGNANPKFFRPTAWSVPQQDRIVKDSHLPFGAVLSPLCRPLYDREVVPVVRHPRPPVRCQRCRGYRSCHAELVDMGRRWLCNLCSMANDVEEADFCNLDTRGYRLDIHEHPELQYGSVEFDVDAFPEYAFRTELNDVVPTRPLHHLFLIDVSRQASAVFLADYVAGVREALQQMAQLTPQCKVAFITFASQLHFYNFRDPNIPQLCVPDVENPFIPLPFTSLCWVEVGAAMELIERFLDRLPTIAMDLGESDCRFGAAVKAAMLVLAGQHGGRVIACTHRHPPSGIGAVTLREQHKLYGTDREKELLRPLEGFWTTTAVEAAKQNISFDLFFFGAEYSELVTLSNLCHVTNGRVFHFPNYDRLIDITKVHALLGQLATEEMGYAGILRVRCSDGLKVQRYQGHFLSQNTQDMDLASVTGSSTFFVDFAHEGKLEGSKYVFFQAALLYTTRGGQRRVRVHSVRLRVATTLTALFKEADLEATLSGFIHDAVVEAVNKGPKAARQNTTDRVVKMLTSYRRYCSSDTTTATLLMPTQLRLMPVYLLCFLKCDAMMEGTVVPIDSRVASIFDIVTMPLHKLLRYLYPSLFAAHSLVADERLGTMDAATGKCILPSHRQLIYDSVATHGVYILCDEQARLVYMWIGNDVPSHTSELLFGTSDARTVCTPGGPGEDSFNERLSNLLYALMLREDGMRRLLVVHQGQHTENAFFNEFAEEKLGNSMSYDQYLVLIHRTVNNNML